MEQLLAALVAVRYLWTQSGARLWIAIKASTFRLQPQSKPASGHLGTDPPLAGWLTPSFLSRKGPAAIT